MKPLQLTKAQQEEFSKRFNDELDKMTMSWDNELHNWYFWAMKALEYARVPNMRITAAEFGKLFQQEKTGLNMNVVAQLCNNLELRSPKEMDSSGKEWVEVLELNDRVADRWKILAKPSEEKVLQYFIEENNKARLMAGVPGGLQMIKGEA